MMRAKYLCRRRRCVWRNADGFCLMAHRCPTGDRFTTEGEVDDQRRKERNPAGVPAPGRAD